MCETIIIPSQISVFFQPLSQNEGSVLQKMLPNLDTHVLLFISLLISSSYIPSKLNQHKENWK